MSCSCITWCLLDSPRPHSWRPSPGRSRESSSVPLVSSAVLFSPSRAFSRQWISFSSSFDLCCCVISFPTFGPTSPWAGLSSSDRKNTILSGKYERTGGDPGSLGDLQAHHPRPLVAHTPFTPPPNTNKSTDTPNAHIHASPFLTAPIASLHSRRASTAPCFTLFCDW